MVITTSPLVKTYTLQEFWDLPEPRDHSKLELIKGVLYMTPPPDNIHQEASTDLHDYLYDIIRKHSCKGRIYMPRTAIWVDDDTYLEPDLMYISNELRKRMDPKHWTSADIVVEVTSPSTEMYDRTTKADTYRAMGVREMWLVNPKKRTVEVRYFESDRTAIFGARDVLTSEVLLGIKFQVRRFFCLPYFFHALLACLDVIGPRDVEGVRKSASYF